MLERPEKDILIIGGGIVGLCCALRLRQAGWRTTIVDPGDFSRAAASGNAGHVAIEQAEPLASRAALRATLGQFVRRRGPLVLPMRDIATWAPFASRLYRLSAPARHETGKAVLGALLADAMPAWRRLADNIGAPDLLIERGHVLVWQDAGRAADGIAAWRKVGTGTATFHEASPTERADLEQRLGIRAAGALVFENTGQIADLTRLYKALLAAFQGAGGRMVRGSVRNIDIADGLASARLDSGETIRPGTMLLAAGAHSGTLLAGFGRKVPLIAERGYHIQAANSRWPIGMPPVVFPERSIIATRFESGLRVAGFVEFASVESPADPRRWATLERHAHDLSLPLEGRLTRWMGARPTLPDYLPAMGRARFARNLLYAFGHNHLGLTLAPVTAQIMSRLALGEMVPRFMASLDLDRFRS